MKQIITDFIYFIISLFGNQKTSSLPVPTVQPIIKTPIPDIAQPLPIPVSPPAPFIDPKLISAIIMVESEGNDNAIGDLHLTNHAYGAMQIRQGLVDICNAHLGTHYKSQDCLGNRNLSITLFTAYFHIFTSLVTNEDRAKAWNGGGGWKQFYGKPNYENYTKNLDAYWAKVQQHLVSSTS